MKTTFITGWEIYVTREFVQIRIRHKETRIELDLSPEMAKRLSKELASAAGNAFLTNPPTARPVPNV